jgi:hypothetical protein
VPIIDEEEKKESPSDVQPQDSQAAQDEETPGNDPADDRDSEEN